MRPLEGSQPSIFRAAPIDSTGAREWDASLVWGVYMFRIVLAGLLVALVISNAKAYSIIKLPVDVTVYLSQVMAQTITQNSPLVLLSAQRLQLHMAILTANVDLFGISGVENWKRNLRRIGL
jgi:hypothetical protein